MLNNLHVSFQMYKAKSNKELWAFLFNDLLLLTHAAKQFTSSGLDKLFSNKNNVQLKMYKPVNHAVISQIRFLSFFISYLPLYHVYLFL